jgi:hypothetical protein
MTEPLYMLDPDALGARLHTLTDAELRWLAAVCVHWCGQFAEKGMLSASRLLGDLAVACGAKADERRVMADVVEDTPITEAELERWLDGE